MKTGAILTGIVIIAAAAPAATTGNGSLISSAVVVSARRQAGDWHIGCDDVSKGHKCSYYKDGAKIKVRSEDYHDASVHTPTHTEYKPTTYDSPKHTSTNPEFRPSSKTYDPPEYTSSHVKYKSTLSPYDTPKYTSTHEEYKPTTKLPVYKPIHDLYESPLPSYGCRGDCEPYGPPVYTPPSAPEYKPSPPKPTTYDPSAYTPPSPPTYTSISFAYALPSPLQYEPTRLPVPYEKPSPSEDPHGDKWEGPHGGKPEGAHFGKPEKPQSSKPAKPTSSPFCNFVESECVDCNEHPDECDTCNFIFKCGVKKQCTFHGFRETMTFCKEVGEECPWPYWSDDEYDAPKEESEKPHDGKSEKPLGGKRDHPKVPNDEHEQSEDEYAPDDSHTPHDPKGGEKPHVLKPTDYPAQRPKNGTENPHGHGPDRHPYGSDGKKVKST